MSKFIIRLLRSDSWLSGDNSEDPSRTLIKNSAKVFISKDKAEKFIKQVIKDNPHRKYDRTDFLIESHEREGRSNEHN